MKNIFDFKEYFDTGLWHVHTNYVHGNSSVDELCEYAINKKYPLICFSEHINKDPTYNPDSYLSDIFKAKKKYKDQLIVLSGFEVRILENGALNSFSNILYNADIVFMAEHSFSCDKNKDIKKYISALKTCLCKEVVQVWSHPYAIARRKVWDIDRGTKSVLECLCMYNNILVEKSKKNTKNILSDFGMCFHLFGSDLHNIKKTI